MITARELLKEYNKSRRNIGVRLSVTDIPEVRDVNGRISRRRYLFSNDTIMISAVNDYGNSNGDIYITFMYADCKSTSTYLPEDFEMTMLEGEELSNLIDLWEKNQIDKLHSELAHSGNSAALVELFVEDENGACVPASTFLSDKSTFSTNRYNPHVMAYPSGMAGEFQANPSSCLARTIDSIAFGMKHLHSSVIAKNPKARVSSKSVMPISEELMGTLSDTSLAWRNSGVTNAYGLKRGSPDPKSIPFRTAQAALQLQLYGFGDLNNEQAAPIVKTMDATLGVACVSLLAGINHPDYTKIGSLPGDFKTASNGLEYHALSNSWVLHPMIANLVYDFARKCAILGYKGLGKYWQASEEEVISCMMELDVERAHTIMDRNKELMMKLFQAAWPICNGSSAAGVPNLSDDIKPERAREIVWEVFYNGIGTLIKDVNDVTTNWTLDGTWIEHSEGDGKNVWRSINEAYGKRKFPNQIVG